MPSTRAEDWQPSFTGDADVQICYSVFGSGETKVVCVMGWTMPQENWAVQIRHWLNTNHDRRRRGLSDLFSICVLDNRNIGLSSSTPAWRRESSIEEMAADVVDLCVRVLGWSSGFHVVGVSMGGMIGMQVAASWSKYVRSLVLINTNHEGSRNGMTWEGLKIMARLTAAGFYVRKPNPPLQAVHELSEVVTSGRRYIPQPTHLPTEDVSLDPDRDPRSELIRSPGPSSSDADNDLDAEVHPQGPVGHRIRPSRQIWVPIVDALIDLLYGPFLRKFEHRSYLADVRKFTLSELVSRRPSGAKNQHTQLSAIIRWRLPEEDLAEIGRLGVPVTVFVGDSDVLLRPTRARALFDALRANGDSRLGRPAEPPVHQLLKGMDASVKVETFSFSGRSQVGTDAHGRTDSELALQLASAAGSPPSQPGSPSRVAAREDALLHPGFRNKYWVRLSSTDLQTHPDSNAPLMVEAWKPAPGATAVIHRCSTTVVGSEIQLHVFEGE